MRRHGKIPFISSSVLWRTYRFGELWDAVKFYTDVELWALITHLQRHATGQHAFDLLALMDHMHQYHLEHEGIPEYINALEDTQKMVALSNASNTIAEGTLLLIASTSIQKSQRFPRANEKWEDLTKDTQTWDAWKVLYNDAHAKARMNNSALKGQDQFGAANETGVWAPLGASNRDTKPHRAAEEEFDTEGGTAEMEGSSIIPRLRLPTTRRY